MGSCVGPPKWSRAALTVVGALTGAALIPSAALADIPSFGIASASATPQGTSPLVTSDTPGPNSEVQTVLVIRVPNAQTTDATNISVSSTLPTGAVFVGPPTFTLQGGGANSAGTCVVTTTSFSCTGGTLGALGDNLVITTVINLTTAYTATTFAEPYAPVTANDPGAEVKPVTIPSVPVTPATDLSITKSASPTPDVQHNQNVTYTMIVSNNGPSAAPAPSVVDTLPAGQVFNAGLPSPGCTAVGQVVTCTNADLSNGSTRTDIVVAKAGTIGPNQTDSATVSSAATDTNPGNNTATASVNVVPSADLSLTKTASPNPVIAGQQLTYTLTATNLGPDPAVNPVFVDVLPAGEVFQKEGTGAGSASCAAVGQNVTCAPGGTIPSGGTSTVTIVVLATAPSATNTATVTSDTADPNLLNNTSTITTTVTPSCNDTRTGRITTAIDLEAGDFLCLKNATVNGSVDVDPGAALTVTGSTISGGITSANAQFITICGSSVTSGGVDIKGTALLVRVGDDDSNCAGNTIGGSLTATGNTGGVEVFGNTVTGSAIVSSNLGASPVADGTPEVEGNHINGSLDCRSNNPLPINDGLINTTGGAKQNQCSSL